MAKDRSGNNASPTVESGARFERPLDLPADVRAELRRLAEAGYPHEVCGLLIGRETPTATRVERLVAAGNLATDRPRDRYVHDPRDFIAADREARRQGLDVVGIWHTHPDHPAVPSTTDAESAWEGYSYVIGSVRARRLAALRAWRFEPPRFVEQTIREP